MKVDLRATPFDRNSFLNSLTIVPENDEERTMLESLSYGNVKMGTESAEEVGERNGLVLIFTKEV
ncbi:MAG: hypothetical protein NT155_03985 [Candidatus Staskawiczbacteria bacterium]|nr:hypothetical protein [Candidatus Staskawiczbacteria bacterium]